MRDIYVVTNLNNDFSAYIFQFICKINFKPILIFISICIRLSIFILCE